MQLKPLLKSLLITGSVQGETRMKGGLMSEIRSVALASAVISSLVQPAHAGTQTAELSSHKSHSTGAAQLLVQRIDNVNKVTFYLLYVCCWWVYLDLMSVCYGI
ncbi:hypothetical protein [Nostoc sp. 'Lobaria pulmonaria (5183) cyanobiont']|uniref:hypothetical protein n=1 Tax=Nostoc sp. 'Lobaria pulmonaria (5183) cyanobiont' TaxID=1618022 RepID=UPI000CF33D50|nr:hypothetical protein [Nostoc sp. 'Lobaria pulmonaria (5183) cyanobiont']AVH74198.1 hypothetical protein NLP_5950 [Nostoc sp. 'Lobaria pulmonaria (5183) cyanobiont']